VGGDINFKFVRQVDLSKSYPTDDKSSLKGAWSGYVNHFVVGINRISVTAEATVVKFCTQVGYIKSQHTEDEVALLGSRDLLYILRPPVISLGRVKIVKFCTLVDCIKS